MDKWFARVAKNEEKYKKLLVWTIAAGFIFLILSGIFIAITDATGTFYGGGVLAVVGSISFLLSSYISSGLRWTQQNREKGLLEEKLKAIEKKQIEKKIENDYPEETEKIEIPIEKREDVISKPKIIFNQKCEFKNLEELKNHFTKQELDNAKSSCLEAIKK